MRGGVPVVIVVVLLSLHGICQPLTTDGEEGPSGDGTAGGRDILIVEILAAPNPGTDETEFVRIFNQGGGMENISRWGLCDMSTCVDLPGGVLLEGHEDMVIAEDGGRYLNMTGSPPDLHIKGDPVQGSLRITEGVWPRMANDGDHIWVQDENRTIIDVLTYERPYQGTGWDGHPCPAPPSGHTMARSMARDENGERNYQDTNSSRDWPLSNSRRPELVRSRPLVIEGLAQATALRFPADGEELAWLINSTEEALFLNTYEFTSVRMAMLISGLCARVKDVRILLERSPVGGVKETQIRVVEELVSGGCMVRVIGSNVSAGRPGGFGYDHAKYMVIDGETTVVQSENMVPRALGTASWGMNVGWGLALRNGDLSEFFIQVFERDWSSISSMDVTQGEGWWNQADGIEMDEVREGELIPEKPVGDDVLPGARASLKPLLSPDFTEEVLGETIHGAEQRIYMEMLSLEVEWEHVGAVEDNPLLEDLIEAARRGVEVRVLVDGLFQESSENAETLRILNEVAVAEGLDLEARMTRRGQDYLLHNKGIIMDDWVLVSSINWGDTAFRDNREAGVLVKTPGLADIFVSWFEEDWRSCLGDLAMKTDGPGPGPEKGGERPDAYPVCGSLLTAAGILLIVVVVVRRSRSGSEK